MKTFFINYIDNCITKLHIYYKLIKENKDLPPEMPTDRILEYINELLTDFIEFQKQDGLLEDDLFPRNLRSFRTLLLKVEKLEYYGMPIVTHYNKKYDSYFNTLIKSLNQEIKSTVAVPYVCSLSNARDYFWYESTFSTIFIPAVEKYSLLNIPDLVHELAHHIVREYKSDFIEQQDEWFTKYNNLLEREKASSAIQDEKVLAESVLIFSKYWPALWGEELICDLIAVYCLGKAYAWTHLKLCHLKKADMDQDAKHEIYEYSETHPPDAFRMSAIFAMLTYLKIDHKDIQKAWDVYTTSIQQLVTSFYDFYFPTDLINDYVKHVTLICKDICLLSCKENLQNESSIVFKLNKAWELFRNSHRKLIEFESKFINLFSG